MSLMPVLVKLVSYVLEELLALVGFVGEAGRQVDLVVVRLRQLRKEVLQAVAGLLFVGLVDHADHLWHWVFLSRDGSTLRNQSRV